MNLYKHFDTPTTFQWDIKLSQLTSRPSIIRLSKKGERSTLLDYKNTFLYAASVLILTFMHISLLLP